MIIVRIFMGILGLDIMFNGGLILGRMYLVKGVFGIGKIIFVMYFVMVGIFNGESVFYIIFEELGENIK